MAAVAYETIPNFYDTEATTRPKLIEVKEAQSWLLRALSSSLAIRNNVDVRDIPERVSSEIDDLFVFIESHRFDDMKESVSRYVRKESMRRKLGVAALDGNPTEGSSQEFFTAPDMYSNAVAMHMVSSYSLEKFGSVNNAHLSTLHEVDLSDGMPENDIQQDKAVLYCMASAICDVDSGTRLEESAAVSALGYVGS